ncbi:MAG: hypothetical protein ACJ8M1_14990 [Chthoniobacterales bacterium]
MRLPMGVALVATVAFFGCRTAHDVAVSSYRLATSPINLVRHHPAEPANTVTSAPSTTAAAPEVTASQPLSSTPRPAPSIRPRPIPTAAEPTKSAIKNVDPRPSAPPPTSSLDFPTAKPVEGKPGYVYSPFDPGKYVDVSGYAPGSKVKDPYSGKIFLVP